MKIAVVCANGRAGRLITEEALARGMDVTAVVRGENRTAAKKALVKDLFALTKEDLQGFDAVVDAFGAWSAEDVDGICKAAGRLCDLLSGSETRLLVVGGAGSLYVNAEHTACVADGPDFPDAFKPVAAAHAAALDALRKRKDIRWTYISPACDFQAEGERTGGYLLGGEELMLNGRGESAISYADYAIAVADELAGGKHVRERISVVRK